MRMFQKILKYFLLCISYLYLCDSVDDSNITIWTNSGGVGFSKTNPLELPLEFSKQLSEVCILVVINTKSENSSKVIKSYFQKNFHYNIFLNWTFQPEKEIQWQDLIETWKDKQHKELKKIEKFDPHCSAEKIQYIDVFLNKESFKLLDSVVDDARVKPYLVMLFPFLKDMNSISSRHLQSISTTTSSSTAMPTKKPYLSLKPTTVPLLFVTLMILALTVLGFFLLIAIDTPTFFLKTVPPVNKEF